MYWGKADTGSIPQNTIVQTGRTELGPLSSKQWLHQCASEWLSSRTTYISRALSFTTASANLVLKPLLNLLLGASIFDQRAHGHCIPVKFSENCCKYNRTLTT